MNEDSPRTIRAPFKTFPKVCAHCSKEFESFRITAKYCCDTCRARHGDTERRDKVRQEKLTMHGNKCAICEGTSRRMFFRKGLDGHEILLCAKHNAWLSQEMFRRSGKWPTGTPGYLEHLRSLR